MRSMFKAPILKTLALCLFVGIALSACGSREDRAQGYYERGKSYLAQKDYVKARIELRNAIQLKGDMLPPHGARGPGHFALGVRAESLDEWRRRLEAHGVAVEKEVTWPRGGHSLYLRDPTGNSVELVTPGLWGLPSGW